jgi:hypothetical protein
MRYRRFIALLTILAIAQIRVQVTAQIDIEPITGYYLPCAHGTTGTIATYHGINQDGQPPWDPNRRAFDVSCMDSHGVFSPTAGQVYFVTPQYGGVLMIEDKPNDACLVILHLETFAVQTAQVIEAGTYLGDWRGFDLHVVAVDGECMLMRDGLYGMEPRQRERPVIFNEIGELLPFDIPMNMAVAFVSDNPGGEPKMCPREIMAFMWHGEMVHIFWGEAECEDTVPPAEPSSHMGM